MLPRENGTRMADRGTVWGSVARIFQRCAQVVRILSTSSSVRLSMRGGLDRSIDHRGVFRGLDRVHEVEAGFEIENHGRFSNFRQATKNGFAFRLKRDLGYGTPNRPPRKSERCPLLRRQLRWSSK